MTGRVIETSIDISAPVDRVWHVLTDFSSFPQWSRFIVGIEGKPSPGTRISVRLDDGAGIMQIHPQILACGSHELRWRGVLAASFIFSGEHYFRLEPLPGGGTRLTHGETFGGALVPLLWKRLDARTRQAFHRFNAALRERCEAVATSRGLR